MRESLMGHSRIFFIPQAELRLSFQARWTPSVVRGIPQQARGNDAGGNAGEKIMVDASRGILAGSRSAIVQARSEFGNHIPWVKAIVAAGGVVGVGGGRVCKHCEGQRSTF